MISVQKDYDSVPEKLQSSECQQLVRDALAQQNTHKFESKFYNHGCIEELKKLYHNKCAYCETDSSAGAPFEIEHFRPKKKVTGKQEHRGYYWLGYEWSNLLLSCRACNTKKSNKFPIHDEKNRIYHSELSESGLPDEHFCKADSQELLLEGATLLNPELDTVEDHIIFKPNGEIDHLTERGCVTINEILKLNRERLVLRRKKIADDFFNDLKDILADYVQGIISDTDLKASLYRSFKKLLTLQHPKKEYSRFSYFIFTKFEIFADAHLNSKDKQFVLKAFTAFIRENTGI